MKNIDEIRKDYEQHLKQNKKTEHEYPFDDYLYDNYYDEMFLQHA